MDKERLHEEDLQRIRGFRLIDDDFMNACFDDNIEGMNCCFGSSSINPISM